MPSKGDDLDAVAVAVMVEHLANRTAVYRSLDGSVITTLTGVFERPYTEVSGAYAPTASRQPVFTCAENRFPFNWSVSVGDTLEIQVDQQTVTTYTVRSMEPDGTGAVDLMLEEP